jgi:hypothetical protein
VIGKEESKKDEPFLLSTAINRTRRQGDILTMHMLYPWQWCQKENQMHKPPAKSKKFGDCENAARDPRVIKLFGNKYDMER